MSRRTSRPLILVAPRFEPGRIYRDEQLSPNEATTKCYVDAIFAAGGLPLMMNLPNDLMEAEELMHEYVELADGICIQGGPDVHPTCWGDEKDYEGCTFCPGRDTFELPLLRYAVEKDKPLFTICRGTQALNVALGGTLCMDVPNYPRTPGAEVHDHVNSLHQTSHPVEVHEGSLLWRANGGRTGYQVNSAHHCCVGELGEGLVLTAHSDDGVPECIERPDKRFVLGVQWHPEYTWYRSEPDMDLWRAFVAAAAE